LAAFVILISETSQKILHGKAEADIGPSTISGSIQSTAMKPVYVIATADTKGQELAFLASAVRQAGATTICVDVGTRPPTTVVDVEAAEVASCHPDGADAVLGSDDRGTSVAAMGVAFERFISVRDDIGAIIGIGGGGGTSIITRGMRTLPLGLPKLMVSTLASGDVAPYVDVSDIIMVPSITDFAGLNRVSRVVLSNAAQAIADPAFAEAAVQAFREIVG
jgi:uncharacterized protein (UPF0261 family)